jgi:hypothetical protein
MSLREEPKPIAKTLLQSGLIDKAQAQMMEKMGLIPSGASELVRENALKGATEDVLMNLAEELSVAVEKEHAIRETALDLNRIRWPAFIDVLKSSKEKEGLTPIVANLSCVVDQLGRYYVRISEGKESWFVPGYVVLRKLDSNRTSHEYITESQKLFIGEREVCYQVATKVIEVVG